MHRNAGAQRWNGKKEDTRGASNRRDGKGAGGGIRLEIHDVSRNFVVLVIPQLTYTFAEV